MEEKGRIYFFTAEIDFFYLISGVLNREKIRQIQHMGKDVFSFVKSWFMYNF